MTRQTAENILCKDITSMSIEQLQKHKMRLLDAWRESRAFYGMEQAVKTGFYCPVLDDYASGFTPVNMFLTSNLSQRLDDVDKLLEEKLKYENT